MTVVTAAQVAEYRSTVNDLTVAAIGDGKALLSEVADPNPVAVRVGLQEALPSLLQPYMTASAELSAVWYEQLRADAVGGRFSAQLVDGVSDELVSGVARYAVKPLFFESSGTLLALLSSGVQKAIANAGRETIAQNVASDRSSVRYARTPAPGCCAFCAMVASRGAVFASQRSAGGVVGRGIERGVYRDRLGRNIVRGGGVKAAGSQQIGDKYHGFCRCVATPVWEGQPVPYDLAKYERMYDDMTKDGVQDLSFMREKYAIK